MILGSHDHPQGWLGFFVEQFESFWTPQKTCLWLYGCWLIIEFIFREKLNT